MIFGLHLRNMGPQSSAGTLSACAQATETLVTKIAKR